MTFALIFDLDDTLIEESKFQESASRAIAQYLVDARGHDPAAVENAISKAGPPGALDRYQRILATLAEPESPSCIETLVRVHREHKPNLCWHPDVVPMLDAIREFDIRLGIITDGYAATQRGKLDAVKARHVFESTIITDELAPDRAHWKPHPKPYLVACAQLGVPVERAIYVGDNPTKDFYVSAKLPITTVRLIRPNGVYADHGYREGITAHYEIDTLLDLPIVLDRIGVPRK